MTFISIEPHDGWYESTIEDFCDNICPHLGLDISYRDVEFSGFWSQGDGASFTGCFKLSDVCLDDLKASVPTEVDLHEIVGGLQAFVEEHPNIEGRISRLSSRYSHSNTMIMGDYSSENSYCDEETEAFAAADGEATLMRIFRELADWLYSQLNTAYDFYRADATAWAWANAIEERTALQDDLSQLQADVVTNPPQSLIQSNALTVAIAALEDEIETLSSKIDQLSDQFHYWPKEDGPIGIEEFYEKYL